MTPLARSAGLPPKGADGIGGDASRDFPQRGQTESAEALRVAFSEVADGIGGDAPRGFLRSGRRSRQMLCAIPSLMRGFFVQKTAPEKFLKKF